MRAKRTKPGPVPGDFEEHAGLKNAEIMALYGVSRHTVNQWRRETGLRGVIHHGGKKGGYHHACDTTEEIRACLTCPALNCSHGDCARRKAAGA